MKISRNQTKLLTELLSQIRTELGIGVGYSHPFVGHHVDDHDTFIIFESPDLDNDNINIYHADDIEFKHQGPLIFSRVAEYPEHEDEVENFLKMVEDAILAGQIWFDPGFHRETDGVEYDIIKRDEYYKVEIDDGVDDFVYIGTYKELKKFSKKRKVLRPALKFIREVWPAPPFRRRILTAFKRFFSRVISLFRRNK